MAKTKGKSGGWIQKANARMKKKGTVGSFSKSAKRAGRSVSEHAAHVLRPGSRASSTQKARARFAQNMQKIANRRKK